jgi:hypothetical protein
MDTLNNVFEEDPKKAPQIVFVTEGTFHGYTAHVCIRYPMAIIGAGQNKTFLCDYGLQITGKKEKGKKVVLKGMTIRGKPRNGYGLYGDRGLSFLCDSVIFTQCRIGLFAWKTTGRLINCVITQCESDGMVASVNALIELEGSQTKVEGNCTEEDSDDFGVNSYHYTSKIHLLFPLAKESVSTNNQGGGNYGGHGRIETVAQLSTLAVSDN